jgi:hypothetical protein
MCWIRKITEHALRILEALLKSTQAVVEQHVIEVLRVLLDRGEDPNPVVITHVFFCINWSMDTADVICRDIPRIMSIALTSLSKGPQMRSAALM